MNYLRIYNSIIHTAKYRSLPENIYTEKHHIIPKSLGGVNDKTNLVSLTAREHFICHCLLYKIYNNHPHGRVKMGYAIQSMSMSPSSKEKRYIYSRIYERIRKDYNEYMKIIRKQQYEELYLTYVDSCGDFDGFCEKTNYKCKHNTLRNNFLKYVSEYRKFQATMYIEQYSSLYNIYKKCYYNFDELVRVTGYEYKKCHLIRMFDKYVDGYQSENSYEHSLECYTKYFSLFYELNDFNKFKKITNYKGTNQSLVRLFKKYIKNYAYIIGERHKQTQHVKYSRLNKVYISTNRDFKKFCELTEYDKTKNSFNDMCKKYIVE